MSTGISLNDFFYGKTVLVAGANGFIGTNLLKILTKYCSSIRAVSFKSLPQKTYENVTYLNGDLRSRAFCHEIMEEIDYVFMCAASSSGAAVIKDTPLTHLTPNVQMNTNILEASYDRKVKKLLFISSSTVYPPGDQPMSENDINNNYFNQYYAVGWMKRFTEVMCEIYSNQQKNPFKAVIVRPGNLYGPYDKFDPQKSKVIPSLIYKLSNNPSELLVWGDGRDIKDFIYVDDFIEGMLSVFVSKSNSSIFNIAFGRSVDLRHVIDILLDIYDQKDLPIKYDTTKPQMIPVRRIDIAKAQKELNWRPKTSLKIGLSKTVIWFNSKIN